MLLQGANDPPVANSDTIIVWEDDGVHLLSDLLANDVDPDQNDVISIVQIDASDVGVLVFGDQGERLFVVLERARHAFARELR